MKTYTNIKIAIFSLFCCGLSHAQEAKWFISDHKIRTEEGLRVLRVGTACCVYPGGEVFLLPSWEPIKSVYPEELGTLEAAQKIMADRKAKIDAARQRIAA